MAQPSNREVLVKGTVRCLLTKGYSRTTARDIAAASGANLASIGYHFGSKEALLNEALIRIFERRNRQLGKLTAQSGDGDPFGYLSAFFAAASEVFNAPRPVFVALLEAVAQAEHSPELRDQLAAHYREARERFATTIEANVGGEYPEVMASLLMALFDGLVIQWLLDPEQTPTGTVLLDALVELMRTVLEPNDGPVSTSRRGAQTASQASGSSASNRKSRSGPRPASVRAR